MDTFSTRDLKIFTVKTVYFVDKFLLFVLTYVIPCLAFGSLNLHPKWVVVNRIILLFWTVQCWLRNVFIFYPLLATIFSDIKHLIFPESCLCCRRELSKSETHLCFQCTSELPLSYLDKIDSEENAVRKLFLGRLPIELAYAHLRFEKGGASRKILFRIKYKSDRQLAVYFGEEIGKKLLPVNQTQLPDVLIPVPLHHRKEFMRGYNQSEALTEGISTSSGIPQNTKLCSRIRFTETQTKKGRFERWSNLDNVFSISPLIKNYAHIAIVDDVLTTGSTVEQLVLAIRTIHPEVRVSVLTLALA